MEGISDIRISGIDETRPPRIRKEPYINLYFKLIHKAPKDWCEDFNRLGSKIKYPAKIDINAGLIVETWVRKSDEVAPELEAIKDAVKTCTSDYIQRVEAEAQAALNAGGKTEETGEQGRLNKIIAGLDFK